MRNLCFMLLTRPLKQDAASIKYKMPLFALAAIRISHGCNEEATECGLQWSYGFFFYIRYQTV